MDCGLPLKTMEPKGRKKTKAEIFSEYLTNHSRRENSLRRSSRTTSLSNTEITDSDQSQKNSYDFHAASRRSPRSKSSLPKPIDRHESNLKVENYYSRRRDIPKNHDSQKEKKQTLEERSTSSAPIRLSQSSQNSQSSVKKDQDYTSSKFNLSQDTSTGAPFSSFMNTPNRAPSDREIGSHSYENNSQRSSVRNRNELARGYQMASPMFPLSPSQSMGSQSPQMIRPLSFTPGGMNNGEIPGAMGMMPGHPMPRFPGSMTKMEMRDQPPIMPSAGIPDPNPMVMNRFNGLQGQGMPRISLLATPSQLSMKAEECMSQGSSHSPANKMFRTMNKREIKEEMKIGSPAYHGFPSPAQYSNRSQMMDNLSQMERYSPNSSQRFNPPIGQMVNSIERQIRGLPQMYFPKNDMMRNPLYKFEGQYDYKRDEGMIYHDDKPVLQNIVSTCNLNCTLDLQRIATHAKNTEYNPKRFAAAIMKIRQPKTTALVFSSGKMVCTGAKSEEASKIAAKKFAKAIKLMGFDVHFCDFKIQNIVGSCDLGFSIRLEALNQSQSRFCSYDPEIFPGLIYRMLEPRVVVLVFVSGKIVLTGGKSRSQILDAYDYIKPILSLHQQGPEEDDEEGDIKEEKYLKNERFIKDE
ncbi:unnamed protein product [Moneuplotes crassus]|uniref:Uncharacterized protein n=1 Tax=Euplotes crassus TaxID=5936 RepID=A0AAD1U211_EUPCR|nr:unnamed protein product [Moneuplotes crassus]